MVDSPSGGNQFRELWDAAEGEFEALTGKKLRDASKATGSQSIVESFLAKLGPHDAKDGSKKDKAKEILGSVLMFVGTVGKVAGQAASMVFGGPAELCSNALAFLLEIPGKIGKVYDDLLSLFEEVQGVVTQFQVLETITAKTKIDGQLLTVTHRMLIAFVNICAKYIKFLEGGKRHKFATAFKSVFTDDDCGVMAELEGFKALVRRYNNMVSTVTYKHVLNVEQDGKQALSEITFLSNDRKTEILNRDSLKTIGEILRIPSSDANAPLAALERRKYQYWDEACQWIDHHPFYQSWMSAAPKENLLCIEGDGKSGKKHLLAHIARRLGTRSANQPPVITYYTFATGDDRQFSDTKIENPLNRALKIIALQAAQVHITYAHALKSSLKNTESLHEKSSSELWSILKLSEAFNASDREICIFLGGLERLEKKDCQELLSLLTNQDGKTLKMPRILITGTPSAFHGDMNLSQVLKVAEHNREGIACYIVKQLNNIDCLQGDHSSVVELRSLLRQELPDKVKGNFHAVDQKLRLVEAAINDIRTKDEVLDVLNQDVGSDLEQIIGRKVAALENTLTPDEIEDLNIMLSWLAYGVRAPTVQELEAMLLVHGRNPPVLPLEKRLDKKYSMLLKVENGGVWLLDDVRDYFLSRSEQQRAVPATEQKITLSITIEQADRTTVRQFLWDLTEKFVFDDPTFIDAKSGSSRPTIGIDRVEAQLIMANTCLKFLIEEDNSNTSVLWRYSLRELPNHLIALHDMDLSPLQKKPIAQKLIQFLSDPDVLEGKWEFITEEELIWIEDTSDSTRVPRIIAGWLKDPETFQSLDPWERRWVERNVKQNGEGAAFWKPITTFVAKKWLLQRDWNAQFAFEWIDNFILMTDSQFADVAFAAGASLTRPDAHVSGVDKTDADGDIHSISARERRKTTKVENVQSAAQWSCKSLMLSTNNALYHERLGETLLLLDETQAAIESLNEAKKLPDSDWNVRKTLAQAYDMREDWDNVKLELNEAIERLQDPIEGSEEEGQLLQMLRHLAAVADRSGDIQTALTYHEQILQRKPGHYQSFWAQFRLLSETGEMDRARKKLCGEGDQGGVDSAGELLHEHLAQYLDNEYLSDFSTFQYLRFAMQDQQVAETVEAATNKAFQEEFRQSETVRKACFYLNSGLLLGSSKLPGARSKGTRRLEECVRLTAYPSNDWSWTEIYTKAVRHLSLWRSSILGAADLEHSEQSSERFKFEDTIKHALRLQAATEQNHRNASTFLCRHYVLEQEHEKARDLLRQDVQEAMMILEDLDPANDFFGYTVLAEVFKLVGDDVNALVAWSMLGPSDLDVDGTDQHEKRTTNSAPSSGIDLQATTTGQNSSTTDSEPPTERSGPLSFSCDGRCGKTWTYADELWSCKYCPDVQFCGSCLKKLQKDELPRFICDSQHDFLHVPPWSDAHFLERGKNNVRVDGEIDADGRIVNGRLITLDEWRDRVRQMWNLAPVVVEKPE